MKTFSLKQHFLVAMPSLIDMNFSKAVIYIHEHDNYGAMGFVINKPLTTLLGEVLRQLNIEIIAENVENQPVLMGGPVGQDLGFVIHGIDKNDRLTHDNPIAISTAKEMLKDIAQGKGPENYVVSLGYAGWEAGQLEKELSRNDWLVAPLDSEIIFTSPIERRWEMAAQLIGVNINRLTDQVGHA